MKDFEEEDEQLQGFEEQGSVSVLRRRRIRIFGDGQKSEGILKV